MGPRARYVGPEVPAEVLIWQDPVPAVDHVLIDAADIAALKAKILASGPDDRRAVSARPGPRPRPSAARTSAAAPTARASGCCRRRTWAVNQPATLAKVLDTLEGIRPTSTRAQTGGKKVSLADLIVLGGAAAIEAAAAKAGTPVEVPVRSRPDRRHPGADRRRLLRGDGAGRRRLPQLAGRPDRARRRRSCLVDRAQLLTLTAPEMTVLVGGLRVLGANADGSTHGVFTDRPGTLTQDFFVNLLDMGTTWKPVEGQRGVYRGQRPGDRRAEVDGDPRRPRLRLARAAAGAGRGLRPGRRQGEVPRATSSRPGTR